MSLVGVALAAMCLAGFAAACSGQGPAGGTVTGHLCAYPDTAGP